MEENERTLYENLEYLNETKGIIKQAIIDKGVEVSADTPFREYADKIGDIQGGSGDLDGVITAQEQYIEELEAIIDEKASGGGKKQIISNSRYTYCIVPSVYEQNLIPELENDGLITVYENLPFRYETEGKTFACRILVVPDNACTLSGKSVKFKLAFMKGDVVLVRGNDRTYGPIPTYPSYGSIYLFTNEGIITDEILEEMTDIKIEYEIVE